MQKHVKVAVTGAAGQIGYALIFRIASGQMFGSDTTIDLHLIEVDAAVSALRGVAMELQDCAFPLLKNIITTANLAEGFRDIDWAILVGAAPRKEGMERSDLLKINGGIFKAQGEALNKFASPNVKIFVVGNPCNTNALIAMHYAPNIPRENFYAMTMLDQNRAQFQLAHKANVALTEVKNIIIWGNHSSTQYPDFYHATIAGKPATEMIDLSWLQQEFITTVQKRGAAVINARGASSAASAANAVIDSVYRLTHPGEIFSVACCSQGQYGIDKGLIFSFPCRYENGKVLIQDHWQHEAFSQEKLQLTLQELRQERDAVKDWS